MGAPLAFDFDRDCNLPVSGRTPAARQASASGAQHARLMRSERVQAILGQFRRARFQQFTRGEMAALLGVEQHCLSSAWDAMQHEGWLIGLGTYRRYQSVRTGRTVRQEYYVLTDRGQVIGEVGQ